MATNPAALGALAKGDIENFTVASRPGGIEAQEKAGQSALVQSSDMPLKLHPSKEAFEKVGFTFGEAIDDVFQKATLPQGWRREATSHSMHSDILDADGRKRVSVFYKAAFYDRRADARLLCRYTVEQDYDLPDDQVSYVVRDAGKEIYRTAPAPRVERSYTVQGQHQKVATQWLQDAAPNAQDPTECW